MAQIVKLRRSSVSGQKPTNSNLQLGELALNTTDGKVYMAVSGSLGPTVEELILTNTVNTGSIHLVGDVTASIFTGSFKGNGSGLYNIPSSGVTGLELNKIISGSVSASISPDRGFEVNTNTTITGSINVSSDVSASNFTGSFIGDGSGLYNIPSTGITGLNLSQISSGSVSASISPNNGLVINTNTTITGSLTVSGSFNYVGPQSITGSQQISGSISLYPTNDPDPLGQTTTATHLFVSASNNQTGEDLYIRQQDNKVKWKWFEGKLNSGILWGGALSYSGSTIYITPGSGIIIDQRASATSEISPITHYVNWNAITASCQNLTSSLATYVGIDMSGSLYQQNNYFSVNQYRETIPLGMFNHTNKSSITSYANDVLTAYDDVNQTANFIQAFGPLKLEGLMLTPQSGNLQLTIGSGQSYIYGGFYQQDPNNSSHKITAPIITPQIARVRRDGNGSFIVDNNNGAFYTTIDPSKWDDGTGTLNSLGGGSYAIQRVFFNPFTTRVHVYYGQSFYGTKTAAFQSLSSDPFVEAQYSAHQYVLVGYIIHKGGTSNLANDENQIVQAGLFRNTVGSGGGTGTFASLHDLDDVDIINPNNGDLLVYNSTTNLWEHSKQLTGDYQITGSLRVIGDITAQQYIISSSITHLTQSFLSGSTLFGNSSDDTHQFTGSVKISGSLESNSITGSFSGDATGLTNVPFHITGSDVDGNTYDKQFSKLQFDDSTGLNVSESVAGTAFISIGSHFRDIFVSGSTMLRATGSDAFEIIPQGGIEITTSITDTNGNGYIKELNISTTNLSSSLNDRMDIITGSVDSLNTFSSSVVLTSETASMTVLSASYAMTAAFALNAGGGGEGKTYIHNQTSASTTWTVTHNLGQRYPSIEVFDSSGYVVIPGDILAQSDNTLVVTFPSAQTGKVSVTVGGGLPYISASYIEYVLATDGDKPRWKGGIISGSQQLANLGYATTGSNTFNGNQIISGTTTIGIATMGSKCVTISSNQQIFNLGAFDGANFDYVVKNGTNMRAGLIMSAWNGSSAVYNESSTMDLGSTSGVTFTVSNTGALNANISSGTWTIEVLYRALGCGTTSPTSTNYFISNGFSAPNYCDGLFGSNNSVYGDFSDWLDVTRFYTNSSLTTPFNGDNKYYGNSTADYGTTLQIDSDGYVIGNYAC